MSDDQVIAALRHIPFSHALRWCEPGSSGCGCMGCANLGQAGLARAGVTKEQWARCIKEATRQFMD